LITSEQLRAARALLRWEQKTLVDASKVSLATIKRLEGRPGVVTANQPTIDALVRCLETAGVEFTNGGQPGVRLRLRKTLKVVHSPSAPDARCELVETLGESQPFKVIFWLNGQIRNTTPVPSISEGDEVIGLAMKQLEDAVGRGEV
jgi:transcriptional regulator with XRE-family HTH domain